MSLEYESRTTVLGKFGEVCQGPNLDWRHKCNDEIIEATMIVLTDQLWRDLPYQAIVGESSSINFREPFGFEEGGDDANCSPSTANLTTEICDFVLPNLETISIGTESKHYEEWQDKFCEKFPEFRGFSPFRNRNGRIEFLISDDRVADMTFAGEVAGELSKAIWDHLYRTFWLGKKENVDQFDGLFEIFDDGISSQGTCDTYPLVPTCINWAEYILGSAAVAAGGTAHPGDVVLEVGDLDRPGDAPADNIVTIYPGTDFETTLDITGMDVVDFMTAWWELVENEWGIDVIDWLLGVGKNQTRCLAEVAACKKACKGGDCRQLLVGDNRDADRAAREQAFIQGKYVELYPYDVRVPMLQSPALKQRNKILFMPWSFRTEDGPAMSLLWVWRDNQAAANDLFRDVPGLERYFERGGLRPTELHNLSEFKDVSASFEARAWDWLSAQNDNCFKWWNNAKMALIPQAPHLWMCIDGVSCDAVITLPCPNPGIQVDILSCAATTPNLVYEFTFDNSGGDFQNCGVGTPVTVYSASGATALRGEVTAVTGTSLDDPASVEVTLDAAGPFADCTWDGTALDAGGKLVYSNC